MNRACGVPNDVLDDWCMATKEFLSEKEVFDSVFIREIQSADSLEVFGPFPSKVQSIMGISLPLYPDLRASPTNYHRSLTSQLLDRRVIGVGRSDKQCEKDDTRVLWLNSCDLLINQRQGIFLFLMFKLGFLPGV